MAGFRGNAILRRLPPEGVACRAVEVGVDEGTLSGWLLGWHRNLTLVMVDSWGVTSYRDEAGCSKARKRALACTSAEAERRIVLEGLSVDMATRVVSDGSLDLAFIDADHEYESVRDDIAAWLPKVRAGGWIGGHDYMKNGGFRGVDQAVDEAFPDGVELDEDSTWWVRV